MTNYPEQDGVVWCSECHKDTVRVMGKTTKYWWCDYCEKAVDIYQNDQPKTKDYPELDDSEIWGILAPLKVAACKYHPSDYHNTIKDCPYPNDLVDEAAHKLRALMIRESEPHIRRAEALNDGLRRAAEFMHANKLLPPDTTTVDGIRSYFLNEARFKEQLSASTLDMGSPAARGKK